MEVLCSLLANSVQQSPQHSIVGVMDTVFAASVPVSHKLSFSIILQGTDTDYGSGHALDLRILNDKGEMSSECGQELLFKFPEQMEGVLFPTVYLAGDIDGIIFPKYGAYLFEVKVDGQVIRHLPIYVKPAQ